MATNKIKRFFNVYECLNIDKSEKKEVIFDEIIKKLSEINNKLKSAQCANKDLLLHYQYLLIKTLTYFRTDEGKQKYDELLEANIKEEEHQNNTLLFTNLIKVIEKLEERYEMYLDMEYYKVLEIISFIINISNKKYRKVTSKLCNQDFAANYIIRVFNNAYLNKRKNVTVDDFITTTLENENLTCFYREQFASEIFDNWYPTLEK